MLVQISAQLVPYYLGALALTPPHAWSLTGKTEESCALIFGGRGTLAIETVVKQEKLTCLHSFFSPQPL